MHRSRSFEHAHTQSAPFGILCTCAHTCLLILTAESVYYSVHVEQIINDRYQYLLAGIVVWLVCVHLLRGRLYTVRNGLVRRNVKFQWFPHTHIIQFMLTSQ